jgi:hypothetical protein
MSLSFLRSAGITFAWALAREFFASVLKNLERKILYNGARQMIRYRPDIGQISARYRAHRMTRQMAIPSKA